MNMYHDLFYLDHSECTAASCGPLGNCTDGGCTCNEGYEMPPDYLPTSNSYGCIGKKLQYIKTRCYFQNSNIYIFLYYDQYENNT